MSSSDAAILPDWLLPRVAELLQQSHRPDAFHATIIPGGGNNRVFRVESASAAYLVKWYFYAPQDPRDRLAAEWRFADFAWRHEVRCIPEPIAHDPELQIGIYEFIHGWRLRSGEVSAAHLRAALEFLHQLNRDRDSPDAAALPLASEACFSIAEHIDCVQRRVERLVERCSDPTAVPFIQLQLVPKARRVVATLRDAARARGVSETAQLGPANRILSPSDFGFHNALVDGQGQLRFFDFEYAGWDDPAKTVCDFFTQVEVPVPDEHLDDFISQMSPLADSDFAWRARALRSLYAIKWCCIILNPLLSIGRERRQFSTGRDVALDECLEKAERVFSSIR